jgi:hypothetical protein
MQGSLCGAAEGGAAASCERRPCCPRDSCSGPASSLAPGCSFPVFCSQSRLPLPSAAAEDDPALSAGTTAAWALSCVLRGAGREVGELMGVEGAAEAVARLVAEAPEHLATEAAWVLAYITGEAVHSPAVQCTCFQAAARGPRERCCPLVSVGVGTGSTSIRLRCARLASHAPCASRPPNPTPQPIRPTPAPTSCLPLPDTKAGHPPPRSLPRSAPQPHGGAGCRAAHAVPPDRCSGPGGWPRALQTGAFAMPWAGGRAFLSVCCGIPPAALVCVHLWAC